MYEKDENAPRKKRKMKCRGTPLQKGKKTTTTNREISKCCGMEQKK